jgi:O-glycosyl hydrolase
MTLFEFLKKTVPAFALIITILTSILTFGLSDENSVRIIDSKTYQHFDGWGTSGAWWSQFVGNTAIDEEVAKLLFDQDEGLGLEIFRYNIGGGEKENPNSRIWGDWTKTESFYVYNEQTGQYELDFSRDANARRMMDLAVQNGATDIILFSNSPHFSMTVSGQASGGLTAFSSNLPKENYQQFVDYVLAVADHFVSLGYPITYISPINEPQWGWGGEWVGQEGCHYTADETVELLELFAVNMIQNNTPYKLSGPENGTMAKDEFEYQKKFFKSDILNDYCDTYSGHSYWMDNNIKEKWLAGKRFAFYFPDKKFEMSEWCELPCTLDSNSIESALYMANIIQQDLTLLNATSWQSWTAVGRHDEDGGIIRSDTLLRVDPGYSAVRFNKRYFAYRHFTSDIDPGAVRVKVISGNSLGTVETVAFKSEGKLTLVLINNADIPAEIKLKNICDNMKIYTTDIEKNYELTYNGTYTSDIHLEPKSISTVVMYNNN